MTARRYGKTPEAAAVPKSKSNVLWGGAALAATAAALTEWKRRREAQRRLGGANAHRLARTGDEDRTDGGSGRRGAEVRPREETGRSAKTARAGASVVVCPCYASRFDKKGNVPYPPADKSLHTLRVEVNLDYRIILHTN